MKKAFDRNVSRARPRLRLGIAAEATEEVAIADVETDVALSEQVSDAVIADATPSLAEQVKSRAQKAKAPKLSAKEAVEQAITSARALPPAHATTVTTQVEVAQLPLAKLEEPALAAKVEAPVAAKAEPVVAKVEAAPTVAKAEAPEELVEVQTPAAPEPEPAVRRERLKERLRAVRENPRPEPLPPTVAEAGVLAVERIAQLQGELGKVKALNLALSQDLEGARRQAEKATEEARLRMDESRRLSGEMEARVKLLEELESELRALEGERDEALLSLQEARQGLVAAAEQHKGLEEQIAQRDRALADSLVEEERLCGELELAKDEAMALRRSVDALSGERDTLARQVSELTRERADLLEARKALEAVHRALSHAVAR